MTISAQIIEDSISPEGVRLTTMQLRYPRFIHAEAKTHRVIIIDGVVYEEMIDMGFMDDPNFSRNASSSRAIPVKKMIEDLRRDPAMPVYWGSNKSGMQAGDELSEPELSAVKTLWERVMNNAIATAENMMQMGLHKQIANRILEPWAHISVVVTATEWNNFFELRVHPDAQPEMRELAMAMLVAQQSSTPKPLQPGEWHLPYVHEEEFGTMPVTDLIKLSVARCARVSYLTHDGNIPDKEADFKLYDRLVSSIPIHASPAEHQATPDQRVHSRLTHGWWYKDEHGNFVGWRQYRKLLEKNIREI